MTGSAYFQHRYSRIAFMKDLIHQFAAYDLWANTRILERLQREPEALLDRHVKSSFPSLRLTVHHIRDAGNIWYQRVFDKEAIAYGDGVDGLVKVSTVLGDAARGLDDAGLKVTVTYARANGVSHTQTRWQLLTHCFNHASYHRGQVITIMRQLDLDEMPNTDLVAYQRLLLSNKL